MTAAHCAFVISLIAYPEHEQNVAGNTAPLRETGIEVEHTIDEYGARAVQGAAVSRNAIHRGVVARRVKFPEKPSAVGRVGAQKPADASREHDTGNGGDERNRRPHSTISAPTRRDGGIVMPS